jgi:hypothetical protein
VFVIPWVRRPTDLCTLPFSIDILILLDIEMAKWLLGENFH